MAVRRAPPTALGLAVLVSLLATPTVAFAAPPPSVSVGGRVYFDLDRDGAFGPFDAGQGIVQLTLTGPHGLPVVGVDGQAVDPVVSDSDGSYAFDNLPLLEAGEAYTVTANEDYDSGSSQMSRALTAAGDADLGVNFSNVIDGPAIRVWSFTTSEGPETGQHATSPEPQILEPATPVEVSYLIANSGDEPLLDITILSMSTGGGEMGPLDCDFSSLGGPASGTTWSGPMAVGASVDCRSVFSGMAAGESHLNTATVTATSQTTGAAVGEPPGYAGQANASLWYAEVPSFPPTTTAPQPDPAPPDDGVLPGTGAGPYIALVAMLLTVLGLVLVLVAARFGNPRKV